MILVIPFRSVDTTSTIRSFPGNLPIVMYLCSSSDECSSSKNSCLSASRKIPMASENEIPCLTIFTLFFSVSHSNNPSRLFSVIFNIHISMYIILCTNQHKIWKTSIWNFPKIYRIIYFWPYFVTFMKELLALQGVGSRGVNRIRTDEKRFCRPSP